MSAMTALPQVASSEVLAPFRPRSRNTRLQSLAQSLGQDLSIPSDSMACWKVRAPKSVMVSVPKECPEPKQRTRRVQFDLARHRATRKTLTAAGFDSLRTDRNSRFGSRGGLRQVGRGRTSRGTGLIGDVLDIGCAFFRRSTGFLELGQRTGR